MKKEKDYLIIIDGQAVPGTEDIYSYYMRPVWREREQARMRGHREYSLERMLDEGEDVEDHDMRVDEIVAKKLMLEALSDALNTLADDERDIIQELFYNGLSERAYAEKTGIPQKTVNDRKNRILKALRKKLG